MTGVNVPIHLHVHSADRSIYKWLHVAVIMEFSLEYGVLRKLKHIFPNTYQRIKSICSPAKGGTGCYRFNYQPGS